MRKQGLLQDPEIVCVQIEQVSLMVNNLHGIWSVNFAEHELFSVVLQNFVHFMLSCTIFLLICTVFYKDLSDL